MKKKDLEWWSKFREGNKHYLEHEEYMKVCEIYAEIKNLKPFYPCKNCSGTGQILQNYINEINLYYENV